MVFLRQAEPSDSRSLWEWRNDPDARTASLETQPVPWADHEHWYAASLENPARLILVAIDDSETRVGMVRFDFDSAESATVSINVAPAQRGKGAGQRLLHAAIAQVRDDRPALELIAKIRTSNTPSARIFEREGFTRVSETDGIITLRALSQT